ncbi:oxidoreductase [Candidatus Endobugula sertula]|uniref:Oxidoreductase n=1 Tax=Candidatus Endobugula sertula TaxID=62101 RepID=A0A1D2QPK8_9GAMM|nr:oxidoreductase [Candidatus Endobugula sertula]
MKQVMVKSGCATIQNVPAPQVEPGTILVHVSYSCVSLGTEISGVRSSGEAIWQKALKHPEEVKRVMNMVSEQGVQRIQRMVKTKLTSATAIGYSATGIVLEVGEGISDIAPGDRVACAGAECAHHAEVIRVPRNLVARVPTQVEFSAASTVTLGAIALQGIRRCKPELGESIVVFGLGVLGQLTVQLLNANGCRVIATDLDSARVELARKMGADVAFVASESDPSTFCKKVTDGYGADGVIVTAASRSDDILSQAFQACRKKGRVVLVGDVGLKINRADIYKKELDFFVSTSYGPGRYDPTYEEGGIDYPLAYVRWTENRNMEEYLRLLSMKRVNVEPLISQISPLDAAESTYEELKSGAINHLMVLLEYPQRPLEDILESTVGTVLTNTLKKERIGIAIIGAGSFSKGVHLPNIESSQSRYQLQAIVGRTGHHTKAVADQFGAAYATTDINKVLTDPDVDAVLIATRHRQHGSLVLEALTSNKHVVVEKPLTLKESELDAIKAFYDNNPDGPILLTGFNRRFSPYMKKVKEIVSNRNDSMMINYRMNAGYIPLDNWVHGEEGGGRNLGEACHIYDLFTYLVDEKVVKIEVLAVRPQTKSYLMNDNFMVMLSFSDGSLANLTYSALGSHSYPKEQMEIYVDGKVIELDDYKTLEIFSSKKPTKMKAKYVDKGHKQEMVEFADALLTGGSWPIPLWQQVQATRIALEVEKQIQS